MAKNDILAEPGVEEEALPVEQEEVEEEIEASSEEVEEEASVEVETSAKDKEEPSDKEKYENVKIALREARKESQGLKSEYEGLKQQMAEFAKMRDELDEYRKRKQEEDTLAKFKENPAEYLLEGQEKLAQELREIQEGTQKQTEAQMQQQQFESTVRSHVDNYIRENPDYPPAYNFVKERRIKEYEIMGYPPEQYENLFNQESMNLAYTALQSGNNPAELVHKLAQTWGYTPTKETKETKGEEQLKRLQDGKQASKTLSKGTSPEEESMLKKIEDMDDEEFDEFWKKEVEPKSLNRH